MTMAQCLVLFLGLWLLLSCAAALVLGRHHRRDEARARRCLDGDIRS